MLEHSKNLHFLFISFTISMEVYIGLEGFTLTKEFILKELVIFYPNNEFNHYIIKNPPKYLSEKDSRTVRYATENINNLSWYDGDIPYDSVGRILKKVRDWKVYTYGDFAKRFLRKYLPNTVIVDIQTDCKMPTTLECCDCFRNHPPRYCAKAKAKFIKNYISRILLF